MRARRGLIPSSFLVLLFSLILVSCSGGSDAPPPIPPPVPPQALQPPAPAGLIWRRDNALIRSQTDGSGQVTLVDAPGFDPFSIFLSGATLVYHITAPPLPPMANFGLNDIWQVQANGTGNQAVVATTDAEIIRDVFGPWVIYENAVYQNNGFASSTIRYARLDGPGQGLVTDAHAVYRLHVGERAVFERIEQIGGGSIFSVLLDGTDLRQLADKPSGSVGVTYVTPVETVGTQVIFTKSSYPQRIVDLFAVPVTGGPITTLVEGPDYKWVSAIVGSRIVYQRCAFIGVDEFGDPVAGPCDVYSVQSDGNGTVALATQSENETVQGAIGERVIVRRNSGALDSLYSIPAGGGAETLMLTLSAQNEFVSWIVGDRVILKRPTGLWSLKADGSGLVQLTSDASDRTNRSAGPFICFERGPSQPDLWCVPADGSGLATQVATGAYFVSGL